MSGKIDLHMHSTASDGTDTPQQLINQLRKAGITTFSLTDHDSVEGCDEVERALPDGMRFIRGIEFSCITPAGKCHILGYGYEMDAPSMVRALEAGRALRMEKLTRRLNYLAETHGILFSPEEEAWLHGIGSPGKPHLAKLIIRQGRAFNTTEAIKTFIDGCPAGDERIDAALAIQGILGAGGIPVWAHPLGGEGERHLSRDEFEAQLQVLTQLGIQGLECYYSRYTPEEVAFLLDQAEAHGLLVSGGSDYHGTAKDIPLGTLRADDGEPEEGTLSVLEKLLTKEQE